MGTIEVVLCVFVGHFIAVHSVIHEMDALFPQNYPGVFDDIVPFPFKRPLDFTPYDTIFSSWRTRTPDFHMLAELPPIMPIPKVEVFCDDSKLTVRVDKRSSGVMSEEEILLGNGCFSNRELPNQFVFTYSLDECGTTRVMQEGLEVFTNSLHMNLKRPRHTWWPTPSTVHISCIPNRSYANPNFLASTALPEASKTFNMKAMNPSWTSAAESNVYRRGQVVNLQVSAQTRPKERLFIQSCFVSASPEPQTRPRHAVIMNKGCTAPLGSPHAIVQFVASSRPDVVNIVLNTSYLLSELYIHCSVLLSDQGVTFGSKSCNYNLIKSSWENLSGPPEVCECCSSKCKGLPLKHIPEDAKAIVSTGRILIVDKDVEANPELFAEASNAPDTNSLQSNDAAPEDEIISGTSIFRRKFSPAQSVVVVSQDPAARLTLWLPGRVQDAEHGVNIGSESEDSLTVQTSDMVSNDLPEQKRSTTDQESLLNAPQNEIKDDHLNALTLVDMTPQLQKKATEEDSLIKMWLGRFGSELPQEVDIPLADDMTVYVLNQDDFNHMGDEPAQWQEDMAVTDGEGADEAGPVIRSKLQFSKGMDGSQTLSYEEEVVKRQEEGEGVIKRCGSKRKPELRQKGLRSTFLDLLRGMDKAE